YSIRIFQHFLMIYRRSDRGNNTFAYACQNSLLTGAPHQLINVSAYCDPCLGDELDAILCDCCNGRCVDDPGINGQLHGIEDITTSKIDGGGQLEIQRYIGFIRRNQGLDDVIDIPSCKEMRFNVIGCNIQSGFRRSNHRIGHQCGWNFTETHKQEIQEIDAYPGQLRGEPEIYRKQVKQKEKCYDSTYDNQNWRETWVHRFVYKFKALLMA